MSAQTTKLKCDWCRASLRPIEPADYDAGSDELQMEHALSFHVGIERDHLACGSDHCRMHDCEFPVSEYDVCDDCRLTFHALIALIRTKYDEDGDTPPLDRQQLDRSKMLDFLLKHINATHAELQ